MSSEKLAFLADCVADLTKRFDAMVDEDCSKKDAEFGANGVRVGSSIPRTEEEDRRVRAERQKQHEANLEKMKSEAGRKPAVAKASGSGRPFMMS